MPALLPEQNVALALAGFAECPSPELSGAGAAQGPARSCPELSRAGAAQGPSLELSRAGAAQGTGL